MTRISQAHRRSRVAATVITTAVLLSVLLPGMTGSAYACSYRVNAGYGGSGIADVGEDQLTTWLCSGTRLADGQVAAEPAGQVIAAEPPGHPFGYETQDQGFPLLGWLSFGAVALLGLMPLALWLQFRRSSRTRG